MARNRKIQSGVIWFVPALKTVVLCVMLGGSAVGFVLQKNQIYELARQIRDKEAVLERLKWENKVREFQLANLQSPTRLRQRVQEQNLGLGMPQPGQVIWLPEPGTERRGSPEPRFYALGK